LITLFLAGDVMLARGIDQILAHPCGPTLHEGYLKDARDYIAIAERRSGAIPRGAPPDYPWGEALALLDAARPDVRIVNLETSITRSKHWDRRKGIHYRVSPENAAALAAARIDACALANNHVLDWGTEGLLDTLDSLDRLGIHRCGAGRDLDEALRPAVIERPGRSRLAVFSVGCADGGVPPWWAAGPGRPGVAAIGELGDEAIRMLARAIEPWRGPGTIVVLSIHWGPNWGYPIPPDHRRFAHRIIDEAGVHVVHGHSSHHVKAIEVHRGHPILYGCGDLISDYEGIRGHEAYDGDLGLLYLLTLDDGGALTELQMIPTRMQRFRLVRAGKDATRRLADALTTSADSLGTTVAIDEGRLRLGW
jgi:poly-gamma-glutamate synthesis protein (capsule biosynthesis protein)